MNQWHDDGITDGVRKIRLDSWSSLFDFLEMGVFAESGTSHRSYVWRGQRRSSWHLTTSLDRLLGQLNLLTDDEKETERLAKDHLRAFKYAARGRRGLNPAIIGDNEWWALGQHFGLATPLLDWTRSPFAALYFAFEEASPEEDGSRAVYGLSRTTIEVFTEDFHSGPSFEHGRSSLVEIVDPLSDENQRLVSQGGCFTRAPIGLPVDLWVPQAFEGSKIPILLRIEVPNIDRIPCLRALNRMNINHLSLFPDLIGASRATNLRLETEY